MMSDETIQTDITRQPSGSPAEGGGAKLPPDLGRGLAYLKREVKKVTPASIVC